MKTLQLGITGDLSNNGSIHTQTFRRALSYIKNYIDQSSLNIELTIISDQASAEGAMLAAQQLTEQLVDVVIGHFSSDAAYAAAPLYRQHNIALLLPAATADGLTQDFDNVFRVCPNDTQQVLCMQQFMQSQQWKNVLWQGGKSVQQQSLQTIWQGLDMDIKSTQDYDCEVISGRYHQVVSDYQASIQVCPTLMTDDVFHPELLNDIDLKQRQVWICGFDDHQDKSSTHVSQQWHLEQFKQPANTYFFETISAVEHSIASFFGCRPQQDLINSLATTTSQTVIGPLQFVGQENPLASYCIWQAAEYGFSKINNNQG